MPKAVGAQEEAVLRGQDPTVSMSHVHISSGEGVTPEEGQELS